MNCENKFYIDEIILEKGINDVNMGFGIPSNVKIIGLPYNSSIQDVKKYFCKEEDLCE